MGQHLGEPNCANLVWTDLEYLTPRDDRPMMADVRANDLVHWQTTLATRSLGAAGRRLLSGTFALISPGVVALPDERLGFRKGLLVRDPDGHAVQLIEP